MLLNSGASHHVTSNLELLVNTKNIINCPIGLPDGKQVPSTIQGEVILSTNIVLQNVYYVPELNCNSVFISRLVDDLKCTVHFTNTLCVIQDLYLRTLIGIGERRDRLYYFRDPPRICALPNNGIASSNL